MVEYHSRRKSSAGGRLSQQDIYRSYQTSEIHKLGETMFTLTDTRIIEDDTCYLNHSCLGSCACGSLDMAWTTESELEAEGMAYRAIDKGVTLYINEI